MSCAGLLIAWVGALSFGADDPPGPQRPAPSETLSQQELIHRALAAAAIDRIGVDVVSWMTRAQIEGDYLSVTSGERLVADGPPIALGRERLLLVSNYPGSRKLPDQQHYHCIVRLRPDGTVEKTPITFAKWGGPPYAELVVQVGRLLEEIEATPP